MIDQLPVLSEVHGLCCKACGAATSSTFMMLCPVCERAVLASYPSAFFQNVVSLEETHSTMATPIERLGEPIPYELAA